MSKIILFLFIGLVVHSCNKNNTIIIDQEVSTQKQLSQLDTSEIFFYIEWPADALPKNYKKYKNNVIVVTTKSFEAKLQKERYILLNNIINEAEINNNILVMFNGVEVIKDKLHKLRELEPKDLYSVTIDDEKKAKKMLGEQAKSKNVIINTYDLKTDLID
jgi:hypothetical protein